MLYNVFTFPLTHASFSHTCLLSSFLSSLSVFFTACLCTAASCNIHQLLSPHSPFFFYVESWLAVSQSYLANREKEKKKNQVRVLARLVFLLAVEHRFFPSSQPPMRRWLTAQSVVGVSSSYLCLKGFSCALQACVANRQLLSSSSKTSFFPLFLSPRLPFFFFFGSLITYSFTHPKLSPSSSDTAKLPVFLQHN